MGKEDIEKIGFKDTLKIEFEVMEISSVTKRFQEGKINHNISKFHRPQFNLILLVENDNSEHFIDFKSYDLKKNDIVLIGENHVHAFSINHKLEGKAILFTSDFMEVSETGINSFKRIFDIHVMKKLGEESTIRELFNILVNEYGCGSMDKGILYKHLLSSILVKMDMLADEHRMAKNDNEYVRTIVKLDRLIEEFEYQYRDSAKYTKELGYSYKQLNIICKSVTGHTLKKYIDSAIVMEMKRQIIAKDMNLKGLCDFFDFDEETNIVKYFKRHTGMSPKKFKEHYNNFQG